MSQYYQKNRYVSFLDAAEDDNSLWVADICMNGLFKLGKDGSNVEYVASFEMEKAGKSGKMFYSHTFYYENQIFFFPANAFNIAVYNQSTKTMRYIYLPDISGVPGYGTAGYAVYKDWIYLFSSYANCCAIRVHMATWKVEELQIWKEIAEKYSNKKEKWMIPSAVQIGNHVWTGIYHTNRLLKYSLVDGIYEEFVCDYDIHKVLGNETLQELYILQIDKIIICDSKNQKEKQSIVLSNFIGDGNRLLNVLVDERIVVCVPFYEKYILIVNRKNGEIKKYDSFPREFHNFENNNRFFNRGKIGLDYIELFPYMTNGVIRIDRDLKKAEVQSTEIPWQGSIGDLTLKYHYHNSIVEAECNECVYPLEHFLKVLSNDGCHKRKYESGKVGKNIIDVVFTENRGK